MSLTFRMKLKTAPTRNLPRSLLSAISSHPDVINFNQPVVFVLLFYWCYRKLLDHHHQGKIVKVASVSEYEYEQENELLHEAVMSQTTLLVTMSEREKRSLTHFQS